MAEGAAAAQGASRAWYMLALRVCAEAQDAGAEALRAAGAAGVEMVDREHLAPPPDLGPDEVELRAYFPSAVSPEQARAAAGAWVERVRALFPGLGASAPRLEAVREEDWTESWRAHFHPVRLGRFFVHPGWIEADPSAPWALRIDPGLAFGTGLHPTTRLCLLGLDRLLAQGRAASVLDVGCGTGILALGAARAGVPRVLAVDNDPEACRVALENLVLNGLTGRVEVRAGEIHAVEGRFAVVLANILSG
ncbi:MAG TPA: 50S ribosomal protein L11 methyltransferase, partial [Myxococcota bacterium]|nr:50S ribosomal protein L11 methyltransferase [Myxococcota bacterium]